MREDLATDAVDGGGKALCATGAEEEDVEVEVEAFMVVLSKDDGESGNFFEST